MTPQLVEQHLGLRARIDEHERHAVGLDRRVDLGERIARRMPGPGQLGIGLQYRDVGARPLAGHHDLGQQRRRPPPMRHEIGRKLVRPRHGGGQADRREFGRERPEPRQVERQEIAALARSERVQLIEDDELEPAEQRGGAAMRQHQCDLLGRGQQDVGRKHRAGGRGATGACRRCAFRG